MANVTELTGTLKAVIWQAEDGSAIIARVDKHTVKGPLDGSLPLTPGQRYRFHGGWVEHEKYGKQFSFGTYSEATPLHEAGVLAYLKRVAPHVGEIRAGKLWDAFGPRAIETLRQEPEQVVEAGILSQSEAEEASDTLHKESAWETVKVELLDLFQGRGFHLGPLLKACLEHWGARAPDFIRRNPYLLLLKKLPSCGFQRCDRLYLDLGHPPRKLKRQALCAWDAVRTQRGGHTWVSASTAGRALQETIPGAEPLRALRLAIRGGLLARHKEGDLNYLAETQKAHQERVLASSVRQLLGWEKETWTPATLMSEVFSGDNWLDTSEPEEETNGATTP